MEIAAKGGRITAAGMKKIQCSTAAIRVAKRPVTEARPGSPVGRAEGDSQFPSQQSVPREEGM